MTKNEQLLSYIKELKIGTKISVRQMAQDMDVSEGTAYKAIKDAQMEEYVSTIPRVGTIRIEKFEKQRLDRVTFSELVNIVEGQIVAGHEGIYKTVNKFVIGAMALGDIEKYISEGDLLIVGNRDDVQYLALENNCAILVTGGFSCKEEIKKLAQEKKLPILSTSYDTFTIATMINRSISEKLIKKEILLVEDIIPSELYYLDFNHRVADMKKYMAITGHSRYPVVDKNQHVIGIITQRDIAEAQENEPVVELMTSNPITSEINTPVAYISHIMIWEGVEMIPIVKGKKLIGVITRQDVIKGLEQIRNQPHIGEPFQDMIINQCELEETERGVKLS
ncbi:MAG: CBS domain-containing protein, partial [Alkaliphilus sp.]|nr:CBS domain-containing protein [Alkaliphilus sp.]